MYRDFQKNEGGAGTITSLFGFVIMMIVGGIALDVSNAWRVREILQSTAEAAAISAAIHASEPEMDGTPLGTAKLVSETGLEPVKLLKAWQNDSFQYGFYDDNLKTFVRGLAPFNAVQVTLRMQERRQSAVPTFLLWLVGRDHWDIHGAAVARFGTRPDLTCVDPLLSVKARADIGATDAYLGICLYAQATVTYGGTPVWQSDKVSQLIDGLLAQTLGLDASREVAGLTGSLFNTILPAGWNPVDLKATLLAAANEADVTIQAKDLNDIQLHSGASYRIECDRYDVAVIPPGTHLERMFLVSECPIRFEADVKVTASLIISDLMSVLDVVHTDFVQPDALLHTPPPCAAGKGVKVMLYVDAAMAARIPALVSEDSPLGRFLKDTVTTTGGLLGDLQNIVGPAFNTLTEEVNNTLQELDLIPVCLNAHTLLSSDTIVLR